MNLYSSPEKFGLVEVEWSDGCYQFDLTVVWRDTQTGALYFADDSGCSCPVPFESTGRDNLTLIDRPQVLIDHVGEHVKGLFDWDEQANARAKSAAAELIQKVRGMLR